MSIMYTCLLIVLSALTLLLTPTYSFPKFAGSFWTYHGPEHQDDYGCGKGWKSYNSHCYKIVKEKETKDAAQEKCKEEKASLVKINNEEESKWIYTNSGLPYVTVRGKRHAEVFWTDGARRRDCKSEWIWSDGSKIWYTNWDSDEPNNSNGREDCINISTDGTWNDISCDEELYYICEKIVA